jgi:dTDP-4-dehydrorhamnose reductase
MRYLITGGSGQLAREFARLLAKSSAEVIAPPEASCDITDMPLVEHLVSARRPDIILNCAAYNHVDAAESDRGAAMRVNAEGPRNLATAAKKYGARLVHFSSDYVFDGSKETGLYVEEDVPHPLNTYGESKRAGEQAVRELLPDRSLVLRLSWVFGEGTQNFIFKFLQRVAGAEPLKVTCDEFSVPTWTRTVVAVTLRALERDVQGLYHVTNSGYCSRYEWAQQILKLRGLERFIRPISMDSFSLPARRPKFSAMSNGSISSILSMDLPSWQEAVSLFIKETNIL